MSDAPRPGCPATFTAGQVAQIIAVGCELEAAVQPHRMKTWLNTTEKDPETFQREIENVCKTYLEAPVLIFQ